MRIKAPPETVFTYFTDPARLVQWMGTEATLDPRPGGRCRIRLNELSVMVGEYVQVEPYRRIVLTWGYEQDLFAMPPQSTRVEVVLTPEGEGTVVLLSHSGLPGAPAEGSSRAGWSHVLSRLVIAAPGGDPGPDPWRDPDVAIRDVQDAIAAVPPD